MEQVTGVGGVFMRAHDAAKLRRWYAEALGIAVEEYGGAQFNRTPGGSTTWAVFERDSNHRGRPDRFELWQPPDEN